MKREMTYEEVKRIYHCSKITIINRFLHLNLPIPMFNQSKRPILISDKDIKKVKKYLQKFKVGYRRCSEALTLRGYLISEWKTRKIFEMEGLYCFEKPFKEINPHPSRFVASFAGQIWHTDLHFIQKGEHQEIIIAFVDDRSRYIVHAEVIESKSSLHTANVLRNALLGNPKPHTLVIDNGTEFIGHNFQTVLEEFSIKCHRTHPYTPEENGKIERLWRTLYSTCTENTSLQDLIQEYNYYWPHQSLRGLTGQKMTPKQAWDTMEHWENQEKISIIYSQTSEEQNE
ncbi:MAG: DDE-type integrase/transposase/recombinase [Firmicutes bacterium]|nr:DDE-type integrase/transposase/recombinase [Bacillota bacterium]